MPIFAPTQRKDQCDISAPFTEKLGLATQCAFKSSTDAFSGALLGSLLLAPTSEKVH